MGLPVRVESIAADGRATCVTHRGEVYAEPVQTALLDQLPDRGDWLLVHIDTAIARLEAEEAEQVGNALEAVARAARGEPFQHLIADLVDREPQLPPHLRGTADDHSVASKESAP